MRCIHESHAVCCFLLTLHLDQDLEQLGRGEANGEQLVEEKLADFIKSVKK